MSSDVGRTTSFYTREMNEREMNIGDEGRTGSIDIELNLERK